MSGHERDRLSAYLDGELRPAERAEVAAHLAVCPACADVLADLAAVDARAAGLPADPPDGYFDRFPSRVIARLQATPRERVRAFRPPAWTWAAAAALLLAVVTPLTLGRGRARVVAPSPAATAAPPGGAAAKAAPRREAEHDAVRVHDAAPSPLARRRPAPPPATAPFAAPPPPTGPAREARLERETAGGREMKEAVAASGLEEASALADTLTVPESGPPPLTRSAAAPAAASLESAAAPLAGGRAASAPSAVVDEAAREFRRLDSRRPGSADEWRHVRDAWRAFAEAHPDDRRADEARVRAIEASREAWLAGGEAADAQAFRRDAADYLAAPESRQKPRVERLLEATPSPTGP